MSFQGSTQALRGFNQYIHFTNYSVAHAHLALLGFVAYTMWAAVYYVFPRTTGRALYSERLAWTHWWLTTIGFLGFFLVLTAAGLVAGGRVRAGHPRHPDHPGHQAAVDRAGLGGIRDHRRAVPVRLQHDPHAAAQTDPV